MAGEWKQVVQGVILVTITVLASRRNTPEAHAVSRRLVGVCFAAGRLLRSVVKRMPSKWSAVTLGLIESQTLNAVHGVEEGFIPGLLSDNAAEPPPSSASDDDDEEEEDMADAFDEAIENTAEEPRILTASAVASTSTKESKLFQRLYEYLLKMKRYFCA